MSGSIRRSEAGILLPPYTSGEIAQLIMVEGEHIRSVTERVRYWIKIGLLKPLGDKAPGTGEHHLFSGQMLARARELTELRRTTKEAQRAMRQAS